MNCSDLDEDGAKEWNDALLLVAGGQETGLGSHHFEGKGSVLLNLNRWKVVWGKKPEQYRLKPYLMWSIDEMPVLVEETCSNQEPSEKRDSLSVKRDKQARALRKKIVRINRKLNKLNKTLLEQDEGDGNCGEGVAPQWRVLPEALRNELLAERSAVKDKLRRLTNKVSSTLKNGTSEDVEAEKSSRGQFKVKTVDGDDNSLKCDGVDLTTTAKEGIVVREKCGKNSVQVDRSKSEPSDCSLDKKLKKKRFCRKHHKKGIQGSGKNGETTTEVNLVSKRTTSAHELSKGRFENEGKPEENFGEMKMNREGEFSNRKIVKETEKRKRACDTYNKAKTNRSIDYLDVSSKTNQETNCRLSTKSIKSKKPSMDVLVKSHQIDPCSILKMKKGTLAHKPKYHSQSSPMTLTVKSPDQIDQTVVD